MAYESNLDCRTFEAGADLSAKQYHFMKLNASGQVVSCDAQGEEAKGVLQNDPDAAGKASTVAVGGITKMTAGAAITLNDAITTGADGRAETAATGDVVVGYAREAASADGVLFAMEMTQPRVYTV